MLPTCEGFWQFIDIYITLKIGSGIPHARNRLLHGSHIRCVLPKKKNEAHGAMAMEVLITSNSMQQASPYCLVQVFGANKQLESVDWVIHGVKVGSYWPASFLKTLPGLHDLDENLLQGKRIRQHNNGKFVVSDVAAAVLFENPKNAGQWANYDKHRSIAQASLQLKAGILT